MALFVQASRALPFFRFAVLLGLLLSCLTGPVSAGVPAQQIVNINGVGPQDPIEPERFLPPAPRPDVNPVFTIDATVTLTGTLQGAAELEILGPDGLQTISSPGSTYEVSVALNANVANLFYLTAIAPSGVRSAPTLVRVVRDNQGPQVFVDAPLAGAEVTLDTIDVAGRVGDVLSGFQGLFVTVNGVAADVDVGFGTNGTFLARDVPLIVADPAEPTVLTVIATDALRNTTTRFVSVTRIPVPAGSPTLVVVSGDGQSGPVRSPIAQPLVVEVRNGAGLPLVGKVVRFHVTRSDGRLSTTPGLATGTAAMNAYALSDAQGRARAFWTLGSDSGCGNNRVEVTSVGTFGTTQFCATATPGTADRILLGQGDEQMFEVGAVAPKSLEVFVSDGTNGVAGVPVTYSVARGTGFFGGAKNLTVLTDITGHANATFTMGATFTQNVVDATFTGNPGPPIQFVLTGVRRNPNGPTSFEGLVLDNEQRALGGATCHLEVGGFSFPAVVSDANGAFVFEDLDRDGPAHLVIEGETVTQAGGVSVPANTYPHLAYDTYVVEGKVNRLMTSVFLPELQAQNSRVYDVTADVELTLPDMPGFKMIVKAGSMTRPDGTVPSALDPATIAVNPVHLDEIPMPIPNGVDAPFAWTLQPSGAHFDPPVELQFPNMAGLPAGAAAFALSFNHDTHRFEIVASARVSDDAQRVLSDPGAGISVAGWGAWCPPYPNTGTVEINNLANAKAALLRDQTEKIGTAAEPLATQILCLALAACGADPTQPTGTPLGPKPDWAGPFVESTLIFTADMIADPTIAELNQLLGRFTGGLTNSDALCADIPSWISNVNINIPFTELEVRINDACAVLGGGVHFAEHLMPAFIDYAITNGCDEDLVMQHEGLINNAIIPCFQRLAVDGVLSQDAAAAAVKGIPFMATQSRNFACFVARQVNGEDIDSARDPSMGIPDEYPELPDFTEWLNPALDDWSDLDVSTGGQYYLPVGGTLQLSVMAAGVDVTSSPETIYFPIGPAGLMDVSSTGLVSVHGTGLPLVNMSTPSYVLVLSNSQFGIAQIGVVDVDTDGDLIVDFVEASLGLDPLSPNSFDSDMDGDSLPDIFEVMMFSDPLNPDVDMDGVTDREELEQRSHFLLADSSGPRLTEDHDVRVGTRGRRVDENGGFFIPGIPAGTNLQRARSVGVANGQIWYGASEFLEVEMQVTKSVDAFSLSLTPIPTPGSISASVVDSVLLQNGQTSPITVIGQMSDGSVQDLTARTLGTTYVSSDPDVLSVSQEGVVTAMGSGQVFVTCRNEGVTATVPLLVSVGDPLTTVVGFVEFADGSTADGVIVSVFPGGLTGVTDATGRFEVTDVFTQLGGLTVIADNLPGGNSQVGTIENVAPVPAEFTDAGILVLEEAVFWAVDANGDWGNGANWSTGTPPGPNDNVLIDRGLDSLVITLSSNAGQVKSLRCGENLVLVAGGDLTVDTPFSIKGGFMLDGGRLWQSTILPGPTLQPVQLDKGELDAVVLASDADVDGGGILRISNGLQLVNSSVRIGVDSGFNRVLVDTDDPIGGTGEFFMSPGTSANRIESNVGVELQIGANILVRGGGRLGGSSTALRLLGEARAEGATTMEVTGTDWVNAGLVSASPGALMQLQGSMSFESGGTFAANGGEVQLRGMLLNDGSVLDISATSSNLVLNSGRVVGGTVATSGGATLDNFANGILEDVTLSGEALVRSGTSLTVFGGLTFSGGTVRIQGLLQQAFLSFPGSQSVSGNGTILLEGAIPRAFVAPSGAGATLTIERGVRVAGTGVIGSGNTSVVNRGIIDATEATSKLTVRGADWVQDGELRTAPGAVLELEGTFTLGRGATANTTAGRVEILGTLQNAGSIARVDRFSGNWALHGGRILGGTVASSGGAAWEGDASTGGLDGVTLTGDVVVPPGQALGIENGLVMDGGSITVVGENGVARIFCNGPDQTIDGPGEIVLAGASGTAELRALAPGVLTLGPDLSLRGSGVVGFVNSTIVNLGTLRCDVPGGRLLLRGLNWRNEGSILADAGTTLVAEGTWTQAGSIVGTDAAIELGGTYSFGPASSLMRTGGSLSLRGTILNQGQTFTSDANTGNVELRQCTVRGGELASLSGTEFNCSSFGTTTLEGILLSGTMVVPGGANLRTSLGFDFGGGTLALRGGVVEVSHSEAVGGAGEVIMSAIGGLPRLSSSSAAGALTLGSGVVVRGRGTVGSSSLGLQCAGTLRGDDPTGALVVTGADWVTTGSVVAVNGGRVDLEGTYSLGSGFSLDGSGGEVRLMGTLDNSGTSLALDDSTGSVILAGTLLGGTVVTQGAASVVVSSSSAVMEGVTLAGVVRVENSRRLVSRLGLTLMGGTVELNSTNTSTSLWFEGTQALAGTGQVVMGVVGGGNQLRPSNGSTVTIAPGITVSGRGTVGGAGGVIVNNGTVQANVTGQALSLTGTAWDNHGTVAVQNGGTVFSILGWSTDGNVSIDGSSTWSASGPFVQDGGTVELMGGTLVSTAGVDVQSGTFMGQGQVTGSLNVSGILELGATPGTLAVSGAFTQAPSGLTRLRLNGLAPGAEHDVLAVGGTATLAGTFDLVVGPAYAPQLGDQFQVMTHGGSSGSVALTGATLSPTLKLQANLLPSAIELEVVPGP